MQNSSDDDDDDDDEANISSVNMVLNKIKMDAGTLSEPSFQYPHFF